MSFSFVQDECGRNLLASSCPQKPEFGAVTMTISTIELFRRLQKSGHLVRNATFT
jgi:hypothetical protein